VGIINLQEVVNKKNRSAQRKKKRPTNTKSRDLYDYCSLAKERSILKLMDQAGETGVSRIFSDYVTRINSNCERKMRVCYVTGKDFNLFF